jgi:serine/threonine protein kinase
MALKVLHKDLNDNESSAPLMKKEVIISRELAHNNIIKLYGLEKDAEDRYFIVME